MFPYSYLHQHLKRSLLQRFRRFVGRCQSCGRFRRSVSLMGCGGGGGGGGNDKSLGGCCFPELRIVSAGGWKTPEKMGVSKNSATPNWMVYQGKPYWNCWFGNTTIFGNIHMFRQFLGAMCFTRKILGNMWNCDSGGGGDWLAISWLPWLGIPSPVIEAWQRVPFQHCRIELT